MRYTKKRGGKYIAQGSYGCVFGDPPLKCKNEPTRRDKNVVSKLQDEASTNIEYTEAELWHDIDPDNNFSITPIRKCEYNNINTKNTNQTEKCTVKFKSSSKKLLLYRHGGTDLYSFKVRSENYAYLFGAFYDLLKGLSVAHKNNIVHSDIKPGNILVEQTKRKITFRFIDFGMSYKTSNTEKINMFANGGYAGGSYLYWPFEIKFIREGSLYNNRFFNSSITKYSELLINQGRFAIPRPIMINKNTNDVYKSIELIDILGKLNLKDHLLKLDVYSMGVTICQIVNFYFKHYMTMGDKSNAILKVILPDHSASYPLEMLDIKLSTYLTPEIVELHKTLATNITIPIFTLMLRLLDLNPEDRLTAEEAAKEYKKLLPVIFKYLKDEQMINKLYSAYPNFLDKAPRIQNPPTPSMNYNLDKLFNNNNNFNKTKKRKRRNNNNNSSPRDTKFAKI